MPDAAPGYDKVFRFLSPAHLRGLRCRIVAPAAVRRNCFGRAQINDGTALVGIEFEDGRREVLPRDAICPLDSKMGRQVIAKLAREAKR